mgnify:CR=1 FL=1
MPISSSGLGRQSTNDSLMNSWPPFDRQLLMSFPHLGPDVIDKLRAVGIYSLYDLSVIGVDRAVEMVCESMGSKVWRNRRKALNRAVTACALA